MIIFLAWISGLTLGLLVSGVLLLVVPRRLSAKHIAKRVESLKSIVEAGGVRYPVGVEKLQESFGKWEEVVDLAGYSLCCAWFGYCLHAKELKDAKLEGLMK